MTPSKMGKTKKNLIFHSHSLGMCYFCISSRDLFDKNMITSFHWLHLNNYAPYENKFFNPRNQDHRVAFITLVNSLYRCVTRYAVFTRVKYATTPRIFAERTIHHGVVMDWRGFGQNGPEPIKVLVDMLIDAH